MTNTDWVDYWNDIWIGLLAGFADPLAESGNADFPLLDANGRVAVSDGHLYAGIERVKSWLGKYFICRFLKLLIRISRS